MLGDLLSNSYIYLLVVAAVGFVGYNIWSGVQESNDDAQFVFKKLSELFETRPESYVVRSLNAPDSSKVGNVAIGEFSAITSVYLGPNEIFVASRNKDEFFSIPWDRIDAVSDPSPKRLTLRINRPSGQPTDIEIPWSDNLTLEGWERHKHMNK